ncbi:arsenic metallochaperone ArsD family protein [Anaerococcus sp. ENR1011]|uniref:Arsenic metallochaperone ArsD family protein n=1 Tax=Anaerococcus groningensis TaxID=3115616 RepID=A0ABW9N0U4_9FIRM
MRNLYIYEPSVSSIDSKELDRVNTIVTELTNVGAGITRYNLDDEKEKFDENKIVSRFLDKNGEDVLPIVLLNDEVVITRRYPENSEFYEYLFPDSDLDDMDDEGGCGCGSGATCGC